MHKISPVSAVTDPDPRPYYRRLAKEEPLAFDAGAGAWVAASAAGVEAVLECEELRVRPATEPVPATMEGTALGQIFASLARMNDGRRHASLRATASALLDTFDLDRVTSTARSHAGRLAIEVAREEKELGAYCREVTALTIAAMLRLPTTAQTCELADGFARAFAPGASAEAIRLGVRAAERLRELLPAAPDDDTAANALGFVFQSYEGTSALTAGVLEVLMADAALRDKAAHDEGALCKIFDDVLRDRPPVHNTRRFAAKSVTVLGRRIGEAETVLVSLAAANCDDGNEPRRSYAFGFGKHACPGSAIALAVARAAVGEIVRLNLAAQFEVAGYERSPNVRMPVFARKAAR